ncbi:MAG: hypothetical protein KBT36_08950 [Kurthia sp.]|nr:hypothetical protein [Candidatus Kurthia equi]
MKGYNPYNKGRWYRIFIESDGNDITITESDLNCEISAGYMKMPKGFHIIDEMMDIHSIEGGTAANIGFINRIYADGIQATDLPPVKNFDYAYVYVFGYIE